jgi:hypothetical protein
MGDPVKIMEQMGLPETENGPYVTLLRESIAKEAAKGLVGASGGTWGNNEVGIISQASIPYEERAKSLLAWDWEIAQGHSYRINSIDG